MIYIFLWSSLLHFYQIGLGGNDDDGVKTKGGENHVAQHVDYIDEVYIKCYLLYCFPFFC
jgi:hypothetical protein